MEEVVGYVYVVNFVSGFIWIFQLLLFAYLYYEHQLREKFPQNLILLLLFADTAFRCIWFFLYNDYRSTIYAILFNRTAMLLQFTAITVLMLMWLRALQITQITYALSHRHLDAPTPLPDPDDAMLDVTDEEKSPKTSVLTSNDVKKQKKAQMTSAISGKVLDEASIRAEAERKQRFRLRVAIVVNVCTWSFILGSCAANDESWYSANLIMISFLCSAEAVITLMIGVRTSLMLHKELMPVFQATNSNLATQSRVRQTQSGRLCRLLDSCGCSDLYALYQLFFSPAESALGLQLQRDVLKTLLNVSLIVFVFFFIRSFAFVYKPAAYDLAHGDGYDADVGDSLYPLFYYQFPESLPNLAIALGISPPNSVLRRAVRWVKIYICRNGALRFANSIMRRSGGTSEASQGTGSSSAQTNANSQSHANAVRDTVVIRRSELSDTFSLFLPVDRVTLAALTSSATNSELVSRPLSQGKGPSSDESDEQRHSRRLASAKAASRSLTRPPSNFKRNSNPLTSERVTLSTLQEERAEDLSSSVDVESGGAAPLTDLLKAHLEADTGSKDQEEEKEEEGPIDPLERNTDDSYSLNVSVSESKFADDRRSSLQRDSVRASFNISKPIPINQVSSSRNRRSQRGGVGNNLVSDDDDSYLYDEESMASSGHSVNSTDVSSSLPSAMLTGSSRYSSSAPRSLPTAGSSSYPDIDSTGNSAPSLSRAQQSVLQYMAHSPPGLLMSLRQLSREQSIDPATNRDYLEVLYRLDSIGSYTSAGSYLSGDYEANPMFRQRAKTADSVGLGQSPAASTSVPRTSETNAAKWNWYSQFW